MQIQLQGTQIQDTTKKYFPSIKKRPVDFYKCKRTACS